MLCKHFFALMHRHLTEDGELCLDQYMFLQVIKEKSEQPMLE